jgi:hypothetical protein
VVLQERTQMLGLFAGHGIQALVRRRDGAVTEAAKQLLDLG